MTTTGTAPGTATGTTAADHTIAVTGASGFIGGRIVEHLVLSTGAGVRPVVRGFGRAARLSVLPQERITFRTADLLSEPELEQAFAGCDTVVHCGFGSTGDEDARWAVTVEGTRNVLAAARAAGVRRVVHLSTIDVYDSAGAADLDETTPYRPEDPADREYEQQKVAAEQAVLAADSPGLQTVVLQPGIVYGPWGGQWTVAQLERPAADFAALPSGATGACNAVYVDDVARAATLAVTADGVAGRRFLIGHPEPVAWGTFFDAVRDLRRIGGTPPVDGTGGVPEWELDLYRSPARARFDLARDRLGFRAGVGFSEGMALTAAWAGWAGRVPDPAGVA